MFPRGGLAAAVLFCALLFGCGQPVPTDKSTYIGNWRAENMTLSITADGQVKYKRVQDRGTTSIEAPLQGFDGDDFKVGVGLFTTTFKVSAPPQQGATGWTMTVDGVELRKVDSPDAPPPGLAPPREAPPRPSPPGTISI